MPHHPKPFFRKPLGKWYVQIKGKQHNLGPDETAAWERYHALMAQKDALPDAKAVTSDVVVAVLDSFLEWTKVHQALKTYTWHLGNLQTFIKSMPPGLKVGELKPYHVTRVMDAHTDWSGSTKNGFARSVQRAMKWAEKQGIIDRTPIPHVEKPGRESRELVITPAEFDDLLARFPDEQFRDLLITAWETGCRPQELFAVEARHVDLRNNRWIFKVRESKGKRVSRIVYLSDRAAEITRRLAERYPTGALFRNANGERWEKNAVNRRFLRKKKALGRKLCLYNFRHSFATRMLLAGVDAIIVSMWLGHKDVSTLAKTYQHLQQRPEYLHEQLRRANVKPAEADGAMA